MAEQNLNDSHTGAGNKRARSDEDSSGDEEVAPQHEEMYAGVSNLFAACEATNATRPKRHRTEEEKRQERLAANRRSARESRNRKKLVFEELQRSVARLAEENASLRKENETIRSQMSALKRQFGLPDDAAPAGGAGAGAQGLSGLGGMGSSGDQGLNLAQQQGENQGGGNMDQAQQLAMLEAAQQAQAQQQLQLAAAGLNPFGANLEGSQGGGGDGQGGDYQERLQLFQRRVEERSQLINQLKNSIGGGGGGVGGMGGQGSNSNLEALRRQLQQGQGGDKMAMGAGGF